MRKFSETRRIAEAARGAGFSKEEARNLMENRTKVREMTEGRPLNAAITRDSIRNYFSVITGAKPYNGKSIHDLGNALFNLAEGEKYRDEKNKVKLTDGEKRLMSIGVRALEQALYSGDLRHRQSEVAAPLAFLINRFAKIVERIPKSEWKDLTPDKENFKEFILNTEAFSQDYFSGPRLTARMSELEDDAMTFLKPHQSTEIIHDNIRDFLAAIDEARTSGETDSTVKERSAMLLIRQFLPTFTKHQQYLAEGLIRESDDLESFYFGTNLDHLQKIVEESRDVSFESSKKIKPVERLYFIKMLLIATDIRNKMNLPLAQLLRTDYTDIPGVMKDAEGRYTYSFIIHDLKKEGLRRYSDMHFHPKELPLAMMADAYVSYLKRKKFIKKLERPKT